MVSKIKSSLRKSHPDWDEDKINSVAFATATDLWKKKHGSAPKREDTEHYMKELKKINTIEFCVPVNLIESKEGVVAEGLLISGTAIDETISRNGVKYEAEELKKAADTLKNRPLLNSHRSESIEDILGVVKDARYDENTKSIVFDADVMDETAQKMVRDGRVRHVSIGARAESFEENDSFKTARGLEFLELSLVAVPGVPNARINQGFAQALQEKFDFLKEADAELKNMEEKEMDEKEFNEKLSSVEAQLKTEKESHEALVKDFNSQIDALNKENESLKTENASLKSTVDGYKAKERDALVDSVIEAEMKAGMITEETNSKELEELKSLSDETLVSIKKRIPAVSTSAVAEKSKAKVDLKAEEQSNEKWTVEKTAIGYTIREKK